jgi:hypothetical protein
MSQAPPSRRRWFRFSLGTIFVVILLGCNASPPQPNLETQLEDTTALMGIVDAHIAEENLPPPVAKSIQTVKPDEAIATVEYGTEPKQKKVLTLKKRDGKWTIQPP